VIPREQQFSVLHHFPSQADDQRIREEGGREELVHHSPGQEGGDVTDGAGGREGGGIEDRGQSERRRNEGMQKEREGKRPSIRIYNILLFFPPSLPGHVHPQVVNGFKQTFKSLAHIGGGEEGGVEGGKEAGD